MTPQQIAKLTATLADAEDSRLFPYRDTKGKLTIGIGHNLDDKGISEHVRDILLLEDLVDVEADLDAKLPWWRSLDEARQLALAELCFNMGIGSKVRGLLSFKNTLAALKAGRYDKAAEGLLASKWARDVGPRRSRRIASTIRTGA